MITTHRNVRRARQGHHSQAADHHQQALTLSREIGDQAGEARTLDNLGLVYWRQGYYQQAADHHHQQQA